jgi:hypothetical protein
VWRGSARLFSWLDQTLTKGAKFLQRMLGRSSKPYSEFQLEHSVRQRTDPSTAGRPAGTGLHNRSEPSARPGSPAQDRSEDGFSKRTHQVLSFQPDLSIKLLPPGHPDAQFAGQKNSRKGISRIPKQSKGSASAAFLADLRNEPTKCVCLQW